MFVFYFYTYSFSEMYMIANTFRNHIIYELRIRFLLKHIYTLLTIENNIRRVETLKSNLYFRVLAVKETLIYITYRCSTRKHSDKVQLKFQKVHVKCKQSLFCSKFLITFSLMSYKRVKERSEGKSRDEELAAECGTLLLSYFVPSRLESSFD